MIEPLAHPRYSFGMLLEPRHLAMEHGYGAQRMNGHESRLHDFGTVCGLRVDQHPAPECVNAYAILRPGIAIDGCGREVLVPEDLYVPLHDGATSGWCGAAVAAAPVTAGAPATAGAQVPRTALYVYLRYRECDTDPVPAYARACGCCANDCEHDASVPSVTREGYEAFVSATPPQPWRNPVAAALCSWLAVQLKGPGVAAQGWSVRERSLNEALCAHVTEPCADLCTAGGEVLFLATIQFDAADRLSGIDNCTNRRLVLSTGALFGAVECLAEAVADSYRKPPFLTLSGTVAPAQVNLQLPPQGNQLVYTVTVTNGHVSQTASAFSIQLAFPQPGLTSESAMLSTGSETMTLHANASGVPDAPVSSLAAGKTASLTVPAKYDPAVKHKTGDVLDVWAVINGYAAENTPPVKITTTFVDAGVPGPRVDVRSLSREGAFAQFTVLMDGTGIELPFTQRMDPASAVATVQFATVALDALLDGQVVASPPLAMTWNAPNNDRLRLKFAGATALNALAALINGQAANPKAHAQIRIRLLGGPDGSAPALTPALRGADGTRLDGTPPGAGVLVSGNGVQGGDFEYAINVVFPVIDGPHVVHGSSQLPTQLTFPELPSVINPGLLVAFDETMDPSDPLNNAKNPPSVTLTFTPAGANAKTVPIPFQTTWPTATSLRVRVTEMTPADLAKVGTLTLSLAGGPKNDLPTMVPVLKSTSGKRLDGAPPGGAGGVAKSGDGQQGGDFVWTIAIPPPR